MMLLPRASPELYGVYVSCAVCLCAVDCVVARWYAHFIFGASRACRGMCWILCEAGLVAGALLQGVDGVPRVQPVNITSSNSAGGGDNHYIWAAGYPIVAWQGPLHVVLFYCLCCCYFCYLCWWSWFDRIFVIFSQLYHSDCLLACIDHFLCVSCMAKYIP